MVKMKTQTTPPDLSKLTKRQKLELLDAIDAKKRAAKKRRAAWEPTNFCPKGLSTQLDVIMSEADEKFVFCGNGWGKSSFSVNQALWWADGYNPHTKEYTPVPATIIVVLDAPAKVADVWLKELRKWREIPEEWTFKDGKPHVSRITFPNGSEIRFYFHLQEVLAAESVELDYAIFDEPPPRALYVALMRGTRKKDSKPKMLMVGTPLAAPWLRIEIYEPWLRGDEPGVECFRGSVDANRANLAEGYIERFSKRLSDKEKKIRLDGEFFDLEGLALAHLFKRETHVVRQPTAARIRELAKKERWPCIAAFDPHPSKKNYAVLLAASPKGRMYVLYTYSAKQTARIFIKEFMDIAEGHNLQDMVCDSLGSTDTSGGDGYKSFIEAANEFLKPKKLRIRSTKYEEKKDEAFIERIQEALVISDPAKGPILRIIEDCKDMILDIENVQWQKYRGKDITKPALDIEHKDSLATLKYALAAKPLTLSRRDKVIRTRRPAVAFNNRERKAANE
jgi:hypothetical protein